MSKWGRINVLPKSFQSLFKARNLLVDFPKAVWLLRIKQMRIPIVGYQKNSYQINHFFSLSSTHKAENSNAYQKNLSWWQ